MVPFNEAIQLIKTFEGFHEKACSDPSTGEENYMLGYGTTYYPDGSPVRQGHLCTKEKALEYLNAEVKIISTQIIDLNLGLDLQMLNALISFVHSVGWESFLYSNIVDCCEHEEYSQAAKEMTKWIYDSDYQVIGGLVERRRKEVRLFLSDLLDDSWIGSDILLKAFRNYVASPGQVRAIRKLQEAIDPYALSSFANDFEIDTDPYVEYTQSEYDTIFNL
jgi:lysozyme